MWRAPVAEKRRLVRIRTEWRTTPGPRSRLDRSLATARRGIWI